MGDTTPIQIQWTYFRQGVLKQDIITFGNVLHITGVLA
jgi:hypothetical protein